MEFPYQLTAFLDIEPQQHEPVYVGKNGWFPQIALKRRFKLQGIDEEELLDRLSHYSKKCNEFTIYTGELVKPEKMPVKIIEVQPTAELINFHIGFINLMGSTIVSKYPERDGESYFPHVTAEYGGEMVISAADFINKKFTISKIWILKDIEDENSHAYRPFVIG